MKKLDLHIHTKKTISDPDFAFSIDTLKNYINSMHINGTDALSITAVLGYMAQKFMSK